jgi:early secretory antigenic target protein ESAT-6
VLIKVSFGSMNTAVGDIGSTHGRLQALFDDLQRKVEELGQTWDGAAHQAYVAAQEQWNGMDRRLNDGLEGIGSGVRQANTTFQAAEQANRSIWSA